jgi:hypothetical protein
MDEPRRLGRRWLTHQIGGPDLERHGETADSGQTSGAAGLEPLHRVDTHLGHPDRLHGPAGDRRCGPGRRRRGDWRLASGRYQFSARSRDCPRHRRRRCRWADSAVDPGRDGAVIADTSSGVRVRALLADALGEWAPARREQGLLLTVARALAHRGPGCRVSGRRAGATR